jgi:hypothetical protein
MGKVVLPLDNEEKDLCRCVAAVATAAAVVVVTTV